MIARRRLVDISRKKSWPAQSEFEFDSVGSKEKSAPEQAELNDEAAKAAVMLGKLPADQQRVIRLAIYDGLTHSKISEVTGLSLGTVKTHIRRGLLKLRKALYPASQLVDTSDSLQKEAGS